MATSTGQGGFANRIFCIIAALLALVWLMPGCPAPSADQELKKDLKALKGEVEALKERVIQLETAHKMILEMGKVPQPSKAAEPPAEQLLATQPAQPAAATPLTVDELLKNKDSLIGTRVTVKGMPGPVVMHKKTLFLSGAGGMVEVIYGNLQDKNQVDRLSAQTLETPLTVSGLLSTAPGQAKQAVRLVIMADAVEF
ncbi:MAG: hypothetical protein ACUVXF_09270 [Desulfobaccales bacterium]